MTSEVYEWEPGTSYGAGSIVVYQGVRYKIIQPHTSQPRWEPPNTPALWGRMEEPYYGQQPQQQPGGYNPGYVQPQQAQPQQPQYQSPPPPLGGYGGSQDDKKWDQQQVQQVDVHHEERKKNWLDLDDHRKKQLEIGGGLAAGLALMGAGYYAYHSHKNDEQKKAMAWGLQNWVQEAEVRKRSFEQSGPQGPASWILSEGGNVPPGALPVGQHHGEPLYVCRGFYEGGIQIGKVSPAFEKGAVVGFGFKEVSLPKYEVLVGDPRALRWVDARGRLNLRALGAQPVEGGREADGTPLFIARVLHGDSIVPGKVSEKLDAALIPANNTEITEANYRVLCYA